jgi:ribosomal protein S18 acetylase RimI-like enzyme
MNIRRASSADVDRIRSILLATGFFTDEEVTCAMELVEISLNHPEKNDYAVFVLDDEEASGSEHVVGYICYGPTPLTDGVWDLYWIAVDPNQQGQGLGGLLLRFVENDVRHRNGRMLLIETSSKESYGLTIRFYQQHGYDEISRIKDFYRIEDDKVVFCKHFR